MRIPTISIFSNGGSSSLVKEQSNGIIILLEVAIAAVFTMFPLIFDLPYRDNLYLSWEGTYRLYLGQVPYKDFGMPIGVGYFIIPLMFFKIFGPLMRSLLFAQVFINLLSIVFFRNILKELGVGKSQRILAVLVFTISYCFVFFWPWYNNTAMLYQLAGLYFILIIPSTKSFKYYALIVAGALSIFLSFFTKQDYGGLAFMFSLVIITYTSIIEKDYLRVVWYLVAFAIIATAFIYPFIDYGFLYWFNYGQAPHQSRLGAGSLLNAIFGASAWEKFYIMVIVLLAIENFKSIKDFISNKKEVLFLIIALGFVCEALVTQITSRLPGDGNTYFHAFAFAYILTHIKIEKYTKNIFMLMASIALIIVWWSGMYWKYANRIFHLTTTEETTDVKQVTKVKSEPWRVASFPVYKKIQLPIATMDGIERIKKLSIVKTKGKDLQVLNMSELTPLAYELGYAPQKGVPLWYHLNIGMFPKQVEEQAISIKNNTYDLVLFEAVPSLDNFYPEQLRTELKKSYKQVDSFMAPRKEGDSVIEVFVRK